MGPNLGRPGGGVRIASLTGVQALEAIRARRSIGRLVGPGPTDDELATILAAGACAPDHGGLRPFRFTILRGAGMDGFGEILEAAYRRRCEAADTPVEESRATKERTKLHRAPLVVIVSLVRRPSAKVPAAEQRDAVAAATQNILLAATALGFGSMWRTGDPCTDPEVHRALGLRTDDAVVGFLYLGTTTPEAAKPPNQPMLEGLVDEWAP
jgi:nitroreductase